MPFTHRASQLRCGAGAALCAMLLLTLPAAAAAQAPADRNVVRIDASYLAGALSYSRRVSDTWFVGGGFGLGVDILHALQLPDHLEREDFDHAELIHLAAAASWVPSRSFRADAGLRASVLLFGAEDFSAAVFVGPYVAPAIGFRRIKVGSRMQIGMARHNRHAGLAVLVQPFIVSLAFPW